MAITKDIEKTPELSDQVQRIVWLLSHFTSLAEDEIEAKGLPGGILSLQNAVLIALVVCAVPPIVYIIVHDTPVQTDVSFLISVYSLLIASSLMIVSFLIWRKRRRPSRIDVKLGRLSALISYASQMLEHYSLHPMDQLMLRVQLAESEDMLKRGLKYASVSSEHDLPEEKEFFSALEV